MTESRPGHYEKLTMMLDNYKEMGGKLYVCHPSSESRQLLKENCIDEVDEFVNASKLIGVSADATVITY